jgi:hypothetical protein
VAHWPNPTSLREMQGGKMMDKAKKKLLEKIGCLFNPLPPHQGYSMIFQAGVFISVREIEANTLEQLKTIIKNRKANAILSVLEKLKESDND